MRWGTVVRWFRSVSAKVLLLSLVAVVAAVGIGWIGLSAVSSLHGDVIVAATSQRALHNQAEIDGANHAIPYDALLASTISDPQRLADTADDLAERRATLTDGIAENRQLLAPIETAGLAKAFADVAGPLQAYDNAAAAVEDAIKAGTPVSATQVSAVEDAQEAFDGPLDALTDQINATVNRTAQQAADRSERARRNMLLLLVGAAIVVPLTGALIWRAINQTLNQTNRIVEVVNAAAAGDLTGQVTVTGTDPIGRMGTGLAQLLTDLRRSVGQIGATAQRLSGSADGLLTLSGQMAATAAATYGRANDASDTARHVSGNVDEVSRGSLEMASAIQQIAASAATASAVATSAVTVAETTNAIVAKLDTSSGEITDVVRLISGIAEQTNLLALNATIEAARAGEAGKGFAVVANEVKELAQETARATADITRRIEAIQFDARGAVAAINDIGTIIGQINEIQTTIASAVEEQSATSNAISRHVREAAASSTQIANGVSQVADASNETSQGATQTRRAAEEVADLAGELQQLIASFRY
jgi:methyl-accepting chemotaxis protein